MKRLHYNVRASSFYPTVVLALSVVTAIVCPAQTDPTFRALALAEQARDRARSGALKEALSMYEKALELAPFESEIRLDYATVLGWADLYEDSLREFYLVVNVQPLQPAWVLKELARSELFGGHSDRALTTLERLLSEYGPDEDTLIRKGLALRWLGRSGDAERVYRQAVALFPSSVAARIGVVYSLADSGRYASALAEVNDLLDRWKGNGEVLTAKGQVLNWMGHHLQAQDVFAAIPPEHANDKDVIEGRVLAARWGGAPADAKRNAELLAAGFPNDKNAQKLQRDVSLEYGYSMVSNVRLISDSDGLTDRTYSQQFTFHPVPTHAVFVGFQDRRLSQDTLLEWRRYEVGWTSALHRRVTVQGSTSSVEYADSPRHRSWIGDASLSVAAADTVRLSAGGGSIVMDAFQAARHRIKGALVFGNVTLRPGPRSSVEAQWSQYRFNDGIRRDRVDFIAFRRFFRFRSFRLDFGERSNFLWHNAETTHFFSPSFFQTHLVLIRMSGRITRRFEYQTETGAGIQREPRVSVESPFVASASLTWHCHTNFDLLVDMGRSTSSLERVNPGRGSYTRAFISSSLKFRF